MAKRKSIVNKAFVKELVHKNGKRVNTSFLYALEVHIHSKIEAACKVHNGGAKTLDAEVAYFVGIK